MSVHEVSCKDCGALFSFGENHLSRRLALGLSSDERCPGCQQRAGREAVEVGLRYFQIPGLQLRGEASGSVLGRLPPQLRTHQTLASDQDPLDAVRQGCDLTDAQILEVFAQARKHQVLIVIAPTGMGKSTLLPYALMRPPQSPEFADAQDQFRRFGRVIVGQPRRMAATSISQRVAEAHTGSVEHIGRAHDIGTAIGGEDRSSADNLVTQVTHGTLLNRLLGGHLDGVAAIVIDEAHERDANVELILGLLRRELVLRPDLRVIVVSATIDAKQFQAFFGEEATVVDWSEQRREVTYEVRWAAGPAGLPREAADRQQLERILRLTRHRALEAVALVRQLGTQHPLHGDVLVFAPTNKSVETLVSELRTGLEEKGIPYPVLPLYRELADDGQERAKAAEPSPKVIVATTIAETSITFPRLRHVVDSGLVVQPRWEPEDGSNSYPVRAHSQSGCRQRWGRVGRSAPGLAWCVYTEQEFRALATFSVPALLREDPTVPLLRLIAHGVAVEELAQLGDLLLAACQDDGRKYLERALAAARRRAETSGLVTESSVLTPLGREVLSSLGSRDRALLLPLADRHGCLAEAAVVSAAMEAGIWRRGGGYRWELATTGFQADTRAEIDRRRVALLEGAEDDLDRLLRVVSGWDRLTAQERIQLVHLVHLDARWFASVAERRADHTSRLRVRTKEERQPDPALGQRLRQVLATAWPHRLATRFGPDPDFLLAGEPVQVERDAGVVGTPACLLCMDMKSAGNQGEPAKVRHAWRGEPVLGGEPGLLIAAARPGADVLGELLTRFRYPLGSRLRVVTGAASEAGGVSCWHLASDWCPLPRWGDRSAIPETAAAAARSARQADPGATGETTDVVPEPEIAELTDADAWTNAVDEDGDAEVPTAAEAGDDAEPAQEMRVLVRLAEGCTLGGAEESLEVCGCDGTRPVAGRPDSASLRLLAMGTGLGAVVQGSVVGHDEESVTVRVDARADLEFRLDPAQINIEDAVAARRIPGGAQLELRVACILPGPYVVLSAVPSLLAGYQALLAQGRAAQEPAKRDAARGIVRLGSVSGVPLAAQLVGSAERRSGEGGTVRIFRPPSFAASQWIVDAPPELVDRLRGAGVQVRTGPTAQLIPAKPLDFAPLPALYQWIVERFPERALDLIFAIDTVFRRSHQLRAEPVHPQDASPGARAAEPGSGPPLAAAAGPLLGRVASLYLGAREPGPGVWIRLPDGTPGFLPVGSLPGGRSLDTYVAGDVVPVEPAGEVETGRGAAIRLSAVPRPLTPARIQPGDEFDDAQYLRSVPGLVILRFAGQRAQGAVPESDYAELVRRHPQLRTFRVRVRTPDPLGRVRLGLIDPERSGERAAAG